MRIEMAVLGLMLAPACGSSGGGGDAGVTEQRMWRNGNFGAWIYDNGITTGITQSTFGGTGLTAVAVQDSVSGGTPSLQMTCSTAATCHAAMSLANGSAGITDMTRYRTGHLRFDLKMLVTDATDVHVTLFPPLDVAIPAAALASADFTAVSFALAPDLFGTDGPQGNMPSGPLFDIELTPNAPTANQPMLLVNDVRWTTD